MSSSKELIPQFTLDTGELLAFKTWSASGWVRVMFYFSLVSIALASVLALIMIGYNDNGALVFFGVIGILLCCVGSLIYQRIFFEMIMGCLQIPRLTIAVNKLEEAIRRDWIQKHGGVQVIESVDDITVNID